MASPSAASHHSTKKGEDCSPKSFRLPTGGPSGEYQTLYNNYNSWTAMQDSAGPYFVLSGWRYGTSPDGQDTYGYYWSSSAWTSATNAYALWLNGANSTVHPADHSHKRHGVSLRCLAQNQIKNKKSPKLNKNK